MLMKADPVMEITGTGAFDDYNGMLCSGGNEVETELTMNEIPGRCLMIQTLIEVVVESNPNKVMR